MTTLNVQPEEASRGAPPAPPITPSKSDARDPVALVRPAEPVEILPMLVERPAWPRVFPGL